MTDISFFVLATLDQVSEALPAGSDAMLSGALGAISPHIARFGVLPMRTNRKVSFSYIWFILFYAVFVGAVCWGIGPIPKLHAFYLGVSFPYVISGIVASSKKEPKEPKRIWNAVGVIPPKDMPGIWERFVYFTHSLRK